ncbi:MAG: hypothetical protein WC595_04130 [Candidatus Nanoarchaeia archaeon]
MGLWSWMTSLFGGKEVEAKTTEDPFDAPDETRGILVPPRRVVSSNNSLLRPVVSLEKELGSLYRVLKKTYKKNKKELDAEENNDQECCTQILLIFEKKDTSKAYKMSILSFFSRWESAASCIKSKKNTKADYQRFLNELGLDRLNARKLSTGDKYNLDHHARNVWVLADFLKANTKDILEES